MFDLNSTLTQLGLRYEDLKLEERETLNNWMQALGKNALSIPRIKEYIHSMRDGVEQELTKVGHNSKEDIFLKARLRNYMLLESFLDSPERAKKAIEQSLQGIANRRT